MIFSMMIFQLSLWEEIGVPRENPRHSAKKTLLRIEHAKVEVKDKRGLTTSPPKPRNNAFLYYRKYFKFPHAENLTLSKDILVFFSNT